MAAGPSHSITISIEDQLKTLPDADSNCCIYRVPENLREVNEVAYRPLLVSIGPVFSHDSRLSAMHQQKLRYFKHFLLRSNGSPVEHYREVVKQKVHQARKCYVETIPLPVNQNDFVNMLLLDAVFIIELILKSCPGEIIDVNDRIFSKPRTILEITRDIRLEENQIPFFICNDLYQKAFPTTSKSFLDIAYKFFMGRNAEVTQRVIDANIKHLVDLLRVCHLPSQLRGNDHNRNDGLEFTSSVAKLRDRGVRFIAGTSQNLLDVKFEKGVLEIPKIKLTDDSESMFRNIMVFEQCHHFSDSYIIDYFAFLNSLINTPEDVEILARKGIIENWLGNDEEVANLFSKLFKQTRLRNDKFYYYDICRGLNVYAKSRVHQWCSILLREYMSHPWAIIAIVYAFVILILTVLQVYTGFKSIK